MDKLREAVIEAAQAIRFCEAEFGSVYLLDVISKLESALSSPEPDYEAQVASLNVANERLQINNAEAAAYIRMLGKEVDCHNDWPRINDTVKRYMDRYYPCHKSQ